MARFNLFRHEFLLCSQNCGKTHQSDLEPAGKCRHLLLVLDMAGAIAGKRLTQYDPL